MRICRDCAFFLQKSKDGEVGDCRRHPPTIIEKVLHDRYEGREAPDEEDILQATAFPCVVDSWFCGEFRSSAGYTAYDLGAVARTAA